MGLKLAFFFIFNTTVRERLYHVSMAQLFILPKVKYRKEKVFCEVKNEKNDTTIRM